MTSDVSTDSRTARKKEATRQKIVAAALHLFGTQGFDATTMEQIAEAADIAKGTLYNYFPAKEAILSAYVQGSFETRHSDRIDSLRALPDTRSRLEAILGALVERIQAQPDIFEIFLAYRVRQVVSLRPDTSEASKAALGALALEIITQGQQSGEIRTDLPLGMLVDLFEFIFVEVAKQFYLERETFDARATIAQAVSLFITGVQGES